MCAIKVISEYSCHIFYVIKAVDGVIEISKKNLLRLLSRRGHVGIVMLKAKSDMLIYITSHLQIKTICINLNDEVTLKHL